MQWQYVQRAPRQEIIHLGWKNISLPKKEGREDVECGEGPDTHACSETHVQNDTHTYRDAQKMTSTYSYIHQAYTLMCAHTK